MGRSLSVTVISARDLRNADAEEGGQSDPFVVVCFDNNVSQELGRTETVEDSDCPEWNHSFEIDVTSHIEKVIEETGEEPKMITFCVYDGDETESEALGVSGISFADLLKTGKFEGELPVFMGNGSITVSAGLKKVKKASMLKGDAAVKIAGGVVGTAAVAGLGYYLFNRYQKKKEKLKETEEEEENVRTGFAYGANIEDDDDDEEEKGNLKNWWEMDDEEEDDDDVNKWGGELSDDE